MSIYHSHPPARQGYTSKALTPLVSPVTTQELADWLRLDDASDPVLPGILEAVTSYVIERLQSELINRTRVTTYENWPVVGTITQSHLSHQEARRKQEIILPYATLQSVASVELYGDAFTGYIVQDTTPAQIYIDSPTLTTDGTQPAIKVEYLAGYGATAADVPQVIVTGIKMMAAIMYEHRGACSVADVWNDSGAAQLLTPYKNIAVTL